MQAACKSRLQRGNLLSRDRYRVANQVGAHAEAVSNDSCTESLTRWQDQVFAKAAPRASPKSTKVEHAKGRAR